MARTTQTEKSAKRNVIPRDEYERSMDAKRARGKTKEIKNKNFGRKKMGDIMGATIEANTNTVVRGTTYEVGSKANNGVVLVGNVAHLPHEPRVYTPEVVPFYPPNIAASLPQWDSEKADPDDNWVITQVPDTHKNKTQKDILADQSMGVVFFVPRVWNELQYLVNSLAGKTGECAMFVTVKKLSAQKPHFLAYDWFMPKQNASGAEVSLSVEDTQRYFDHLMEKYPQEFPNLRSVHEKTMHAHSHHTMAMCSWSGVDDKQQTTRDELGFQSDYRLFFLFTIGHGFKCTRVQYTPDLSKKDYAIGVCYAEPVYIVSLTNKRKKELDTMMDDLVKGRSYTTYGAGAHHYTPGVQNYSPGVTHSYPAHRTGFSQLSQNVPNSGANAPTVSTPGVNSILDEDELNGFYWRGDMEGYDYYPTRKAGEAVVKNIVNETNKVVSKTLTDVQNSGSEAKKEEEGKAVLSTWAAKQSASTLFDLIQKKDYTELRDNIDLFTGKMTTALDMLIAEDAVDMVELDESQIDDVQLQLNYLQDTVSMADVPFAQETKVLSDVLEETIVKYTALTMLKDSMEEPEVYIGPSDKGFYIEVLNNAHQVAQSLAEFVVDAACLMVVHGINHEKADYYYKAGLLNYEFTADDLEALALAIEDPDYEIYDLVMSVLPAF